MVERHVSDSDSVRTATYIGARPFVSHIYIADGRKFDRVPTSLVIHYGDRELEVTTSQIWTVLNELFGESK